MKPRDDEGQVSVLIVGFVAVLVVLIGVVVDASAAFLQRAGLNSLADSAALAATDGVQGEAIYTHGLGQRGQIDPEAARNYAEVYLTESGARQMYAGLTAVVSTNNNLVRVRLVAPLDLPLRVPGVGASALISAEAASVVVLTR